MRNVWQALPAATYVLGQEKTGVPGCGEKLTTAFNSWLTP
jgi:hypothetical protein